MIHKIGDVEFLFMGFSIMKETYRLKVMLNLRVYKYKVVDNITALRLPLKYQIME